MSDGSRLTPHASRIPVIAIDGPSATGKGTVARLVARRLGFHFLDSGALYRLAALAALQVGANLDDEAAVAALARTLNIQFEGEEILLNGERVTDAIRAEECGNAASRVAAYPDVRAALLERQRAFRRAPGLVADGRDMASVVFPDAVLKVFLTASPEERAERRYKQLMGKGIHASMPDLLRDILERDARDSARETAPLQQVCDARPLDTTSLSISQVVDRVVALYFAAAGKGA
jgi:3-phosphoshikimate 1-carboxyvinyltransferase/cytidylate kinase